MPSRPASATRRFWILPVVRAVAPYDIQVEALDRHVGAVFARETMKDASGMGKVNGLGDGSEMFRRLFWWQRALPR